MKALPSAGHNNKNAYRKGGPPGMDYFSSETILIYGILIGIAITVSFQMAWNEFKQAQQPKRHTRRS